MQPVQGPDGRIYRPMPVTKVTRPQEELRIGRMSKPWKVYGRTLGIVILAFLLVQFLSLGVMGVKVSHISPLVESYSVPLS